MINVYYVCNRYNVVIGTICERVEYYHSTMHGTLSDGKTQGFYVTEEGNEQELYETVMSRRNQHDYHNNEQQTEYKTLLECCDHFEEFDHIMKG